ncbi:hypothetical protein MMC14_006053 [Varicellaria rhodocarpa]|nr:hypothetical protein [Varicellaria rhodocarpa]
MEAAGQSTEGHQKMETGCCSDAQQSIKKSDKMVLSFDCAVIYCEQKIQEVKQDSEQCTTKTKQSSAEDEKKMRVVLELVEECQKMKTERDNTITQYEQKMRQIEQVSRQNAQNAARAEREIVYYRQRMFLLIEQDSSHRQTIASYQQNQAQFDQKSRDFEENAAECHDTVCLLAAKISDLQETKKVLGETLQAVFDDNLVIVKMVKDFVRQNREAAQAVLNDNLETTRMVEQLAEHIRSTVV